MIGFCKGKAPFPKRKTGKRDGHIRGSKNRIWPFSLTSCRKENIIIPYCSEGTVGSFREKGYKQMKKLEEYVRSIPDFPQEGIIFRDVTSVLEDPDGLHLAIDTMKGLVSDLEYDVVAGAESRGFIFGAPIAYSEHKPFVLIRKKGKLPCETIAQEYDLEYGTAVIEMHRDSVKPGQKVLIVDDLIATGGTTKAMIQLVEQLGGEVVGVVVLIELAGLEGRKRIEGYRLDAAITYPGK